MGARINADSLSGLQGSDIPRVLWQDSERVLRRELRPHLDSARRSVLALLLTSDRPSPLSLGRLDHELNLKRELDPQWSVRPLKIERTGGRVTLLLEDPGGETLDALLGAPMDPPSFLRLTIRIASALAKVHQHGLVHQDLKPGHILVDCDDGAVRFTGFGLASRLPRERKAAKPPEVIAGTLAYMAPEQTGRMNRSVDWRADLYSLGVIYYQMLTGSLPFMATDPVGWVHCHIARQPPPPEARAPAVPGALSGLVRKLLAKTPEERYQTAAGVERDLRRCLDQWERNGRIDEFPLGQDDTPDRLLIPEKLYGRAREVEALCAAFRQVAERGDPAVVLVSGQAGIGKSAVVHELQQVIAVRGGLFAAGKFDEHRRDIPYSSVGQAFGSLVRSLLARSSAELAGWREAFREALGPHVRLITDLVPELKLVLGEPPEVPELPARQAQNRLHLTFHSFVGVFARAEHPLALFLDDLQWVDSATLELVEDLLTRADLRHLLLIGAFRGNEVDALHALTGKLKTIQGAGVRVQDVNVGPLAAQDLAQLVADTLRCEPSHGAELARLIHDKTGGNPFFSIQFMSALVQEDLLHFDHEDARWIWDLNRIRAQKHTDNVVHLMLAKLSRLPTETQAALQALACLGEVATMSMLSKVLGVSGERVHAVLLPAARQELLERFEETYRFTHDRVREAAHAVLPEDRRAATHLQIGRLLAAQTPPGGREEGIFEIVGQLNRGAELMTSADERENLAELNLTAGARAKASGAHASALTYYAAAAGLLPENSWDGSHELTFAIELGRGECELLTGDFAAAERRLASLAGHAADTVERAHVASLRIDLYTASDQPARAVDVGLDHLDSLGLRCSAHPLDDEVRGLYERVWRRIGDHAIEDLIDLPRMCDPGALSTMDVLAKLAAAAAFTDVNLFALVSLRAVDLSLQHGNCDASTWSYVALGMLAGARFGDYQSGVRFGLLGYELTETRGLIRFQARTFLPLGTTVLPWTRHVRACRDLVRRGFEAALKTGDLTVAAYCCNQHNANSLAAGQPLAEAQHDAEGGLRFVQKMRFGFGEAVITTQLALMRMLRGLTPTFGRLDGQEFDEQEIERRFADTPSLALAECWYWVRKLQARFFAGEYGAAMEAWARAQSLLWTSFSRLEVVEHAFCGALSRAAICDSVPAEARASHLDALRADHAQLRLWAENCPENFENRAALVGAEIARLEGRDAEAMRLYEQAVASARTSGFVHNEALANELAGRFYTDRGFERIAQLYLRDARYGYLKWGADGKVRQLDGLYPNLRTQAPPESGEGAIDAPVDHLDLATVIKVSQAVSGAIVQDRLLTTLMRTALEQAGAQRGVLILRRGGKERVAAEAIVVGDTIDVELRDAPIDAEQLPEGILLYVLRTRETVSLDDAARSAFGSEPYIRKRQARSVLCLPLISQSALRGVLYLENNLAPGVFASAGTAVLKLVASQAATALENSHLYRELAEREAEIRRLVDANIVGIFVWREDSVITEANDAFLRIVGYERDDLLSGRLRWQDLTPPDWLERDLKQHVPELNAIGKVQPYEKEYLRKDGRRVPVLVGAARFGDGRNEGVAFVLDLSDRKRAEAETRETERMLRLMQGELAHANRVDTMGQLTASIAHELGQPLAACVNNAAAAARWLNLDPPDIQEAKLALEGVVKNGMRAKDIIQGMRALMKKTSAQTESVAINEAVAEIVAVTRGEAEKSNVAVIMRLTDSLPPIHGNRVQLQQVILNLIVNAIEAMSEAEGPRELLIETAAVADSVVVRVEDSGPGLSADKLEHVFEAFYTTKASGLGLGLSICHSIIEAHHGVLSVTANMPRGARFEVMLPAPVTRE